AARIAVKAYRPLLTAVPDPLRARLSAVLAMTTTPTIDSTHVVRDLPPYQRGGIGGMLATALARLRLHRAEVLIEQGLRVPAPRPYHALYRIALAGDHLARIDARTVGFSDAELSRLYIARTEVDRLLGRDRPGDTAGGAALLSREEVTAPGRAVIAHVIARMPAERITPDQPELPGLTGGLGREDFRDHDAWGVGVIDGFNDELRATGGPPDLVAWAHADGWIYLDRRVYQALRAGHLDENERRQLFAHELAHRNSHGLSEARVQQMAPLPEDLSPLRGAVLGQGPRGPPVFHEVHDRHGRPAWQTPELPATPPAVLDRVVQVTGSAGPDATVTVTGSGVLGWVDHTGGYVLT
ncbi:MAG: hypothetical protein ACRDXB_19140, partial [Actinomycetes bacterium]